MIVERPEGPEQVDIEEFIRESEELLPKIESAMESLMNTMRKFAALNEAIKQEQDPKRKQELEAERTAALVPAEAEKQEYIKLTDRMTYLLNTIQASEEA